MKSSEQPKQQVSSLADIMDAVPEQRVIALDMARIDPSRLSLLEVLEMSEASGIPHDAFAAVLRTGTTLEQARLLYAMAWVILRKAEPAVTFDEVCQMKLEVTGKPLTAAQLAANAKRAEAVVSIAKVAGVSPEEAGQMTIDEVAAAVSIEQKRNQAMSRRTRRKAG